MIAEREDREGLPKIVIIGINEVGSDLIQLVPDIAKRIGIHRIAAGIPKVIGEIISRGSITLNIKFDRVAEIVGDIRGDYWLTQQICRMICVSADVQQTQSIEKIISWDRDVVRGLIVETLRHNYDVPVREFCRGRRFRPSNDPYFKLLKAISEQERSTVDLNELANSRADIRGSINNIKDHRLSVLLERKNSCSRLFYYDAQTKNFALEDPALFYFLKNLDWEDLRQRCGFRADSIDFEFDVALSFAGENRELASFIDEQIRILDISVFYDRNYEDNYLGGPWSKLFKEVFTQKSRLVVALLDKFHFEKVWPTFERDCFDVRVSRAEVVPVMLDDTVFAGIPKDTVGIHFTFDGDLEAHKERVIDEIVMRIATRIDGM